MTTATQLRMHAEHFDALLVVRNHAALLSGALLNDPDPDVAEAARDLRDRVRRADAIGRGEA